MFLSRVAYKLIQGKPTSDMKTMPPNCLAIGLLIFGLVQTFSALDVMAQSKADQLRAIERQRLRALVDADVTTASRLHADDFQLINPRGGTLSKEQYLRDVASGDLNYLEWDPGEMRVRLYGNWAVIRYQAHLRVSVKGSPGRPVRFWHTDLYEKRKGQWQIVWAHATQLSDETSSTNDEKQIADILKKWEDAWNTHDMSAYASLYHDDGVWILWTGNVWKGRQAIEEGHAAVHKTIFRNSVQRENLEELKIVTPNTAIVRFCSILTGSDQAPNGVIRSRKFLVLTKRENEWKISWGQNTRLADTVPDSECFVELRQRAATGR